MKDCYSFFYSQDKRISISYSDLLMGKLFKFLCLLFFFSLNMTTHPAPSLCGLAKDKAELFRERYTILQQVSEFCSNQKMWHNCFIHYVLFSPENTSTWTLYPTCNRNGCWRRRKQISGSVLPKTFYCTHLFIVVFLWLCVSVSFILAEDHWGSAW